MKKLILLSFLVVWCSVVSYSQQVDEPSRDRVNMQQTEEVEDARASGNIAKAGNNIFYLIIAIISVSAIIVLVILLRKNKKSNEELIAFNEELQRTQKLLVTSEKMASLGTMSAGIAHEVNNPMNFIKNGVEALEARLKEDYPKEREELEPLFVIIREGVNRATDIIKSLSHFSRGNARMDEKCNVKDIIENCLLILHNKIKNRIRVSTDFVEGGLVEGNEGRLHQSMLNIIANASQAIEGTGTISIKTKINGDDLEVYVEDDGIGISEENLNKIKDPFFTTKEPGKGTGLGLFITQTIIDEHNGNIDVISNINKGTIFIVTLPLLKR